MAALVFSFLRFAKLVTTLLFSPNPNSCEHLFKARSLFLCKLCFRHLHTGHLESAGVLVGKEQGGACSVSGSVYRNLLFFSLLQIPSFQQDKSPVSLIIEGPFLMSLMITLYV